MEDITKNLKIAILLTTVIFLLEFAGGLFSNSLALLSDAAHVFMDAVALLLTYGAMRIARRPSNGTVTFGYHRFEIIAALINGVTMILISFFIFYEAYERILNPAPVKGFMVFFIATAGFIVNTWVASKLHGHHDLNVKGAYLHVIGDALASIAVITGAVIIIFTQKTIIDPLFGILIGILLLYGSIRLVFSSIHILLEFAPKHVDSEALIKALTEIEGIKGVHDIHIWSICSNIHAMSAHLFVDSIHLHQTEDLINKTNRILRERFQIIHTTLQFECFDCAHVELKHEEHD